MFLIIWLAEIQLTSETPGTTKMKPGSFPAWVRMLKQNGPERAVCPLWLYPKIASVYQDEKGQSLRLRVTGNVPSSAQSESYWLGSPLRRPVTPGVCGSVHSKLELKKMWRMEP